MPTDPRSLLKVAAYVTLVMLAIYVPQVLGWPLWMPLLLAPVAGVVAFLAVGRNIK